MQPRLSKDQITEIKGDNENFPRFNTMPEAELDALLNECPLNQMQLQVLDIIIESVFTPLEQALAEGKDNAALVATHLTASLDDLLERDDFIKALAKITDEEDSNYLLSKSLLRVRDLTQIDDNSLRQNMLARYGAFDPRTPTDTFITDQIRKFTKTALSKVQTNELDQIITARKTLEQTREQNAKLRSTLIADSHDDLQSIISRITSNFTSSLLTQIKAQLDLHPYTPITQKQTNGLSKNVVLALNEYLSQLHTFTTIKAQYNQHLNQWRLSFANTSIQPEIITGLLGYIVAGDLFQTLPDSPSDHLRFALQQACAITDEQASKKICILIPNISLSKINILLEIRKKSIEICRLLLNKRESLDHYVNIGELSETDISKHAYQLAGELNAISIKTTINQNFVLILKLQFNIPFDPHTQERLFYMYLTLKYAALFTPLLPMMKQYFHHIEYPFTQTSYTPPSFDMASTIDRVFTPQEKAMIIQAGGLSTTTTTYQSFNDAQQSIRRDLSGNPMRLFATSDGQQVIGNMMNTLLQQTANLSNNSNDFETNFASIMQNLFLQQQQQPSNTFRPGGGSQQQ